MRQPSAIPAVALAGARVFRGSGEGSLPRSGSLESAGFSRLVGETPPAAPSRRSAGMRQRRRPLRASCAARQSRFPSFPRSLHVAGGGRRGAGSGRRSQREVLRRPLYWGSRTATGARQRRGTTRARLRRPRVPLLPRPVTAG